MDATEFSRLSEQTLGTLNRDLDKIAEDYDVEVVYQGGVLTLEVEEPQLSRMVVSPASAVSQIWISAQATSFKLDWDEGRGAFVLGKTGETLRALLGRLIGEDLGVGPLSL